MADQKTDPIDPTNNPDEPPAGPNGNPPDEPPAGPNDDVKDSHGV